MQRILIYIVFFFIVTSCSDLFDWEGELTTKTIPLETFDRLNIRGNYHVQLIQDSANYIEINAGEKIINDIHFNYDSVTLNIDDNISFKSTKIFSQPVITFHLSDIPTIIIKNTCKLTTLEPLNKNAFFIASTGEIAEVDMEFASGNIRFYNNKGTNGIYKFRGNVSNCDCFVYAAAKLDISELSAEKKLVENHSIANAFIGSCNQLEVGIFDRGKVYYKGDPEIIVVEGTTTENLIKINEK